MASPEGHLRLASDRLELELDPADGAKVTRLRCVRHEREWLHRAPALPAEGRFGASRSWGWDELFPTVLAHEAPPAPWSRPLRDHGELWGRPWTAAGDGRTLSFETPRRYRFSRSLSVEGGTVTAVYRLDNLGREPLPWMWAMHPILAAAPGDRLELPGVETVAVSYARPDRTAEGRTAAWPDVSHMTLDHLPPADGATALKLYANVSTASVSGSGCRLTVTADTPYLGIYVNLGGWPEARSGLYQLGLEPTTAPVDDLATAVDSGLHRIAQPGETLRWSVEMAVD